MDAYVHVGTGKTGTSSIQVFLAQNRSLLMEHGCLFPMVPGKARLTDLGFYIRTNEQLQQMPIWLRRSPVRPEDFRDRFRTNLIAEVENSGANRVVFSDENLYGASPDAIERLRRLIESMADRVFVVVYLRRQDDHLVSRYQQAVKAGETRTLIEFAEQSRHHMYDYHERLSEWTQHMQPTEVIVRPFEPSAFPQGSLHKDFLAAVGATHLSAKIPEPSLIRNESLGADGGRVREIAEPI